MYYEREKEDAPTASFLPQDGYKIYGFSHEDIKA